MLNMKEYKIIEIMGDFSTLINNIVKAENEEHAKKEIIENIKDNIDKYLYAVVEEV